MATPDWEVTSALLAARSPPEILAALSRVEWRREHPHTDCPANRIATLGDPPALVEIAPVGEGMDVDGIVEPLLGHPAEEIHELLSAVIGDAANGYRLAFVLHPHTSHLAVSFRESDGKIITPWSLEVIHERWRTLPDGKRPRHPLGPLVRIWQGRPRHVDYCEWEERGRILPSRLAMMAAKGNTLGSAGLFLPAAHVVGGPDANGRQLVLSGFERSRNSPALPLALYHLGIGNRAPCQRGRGAPLALRLFIEAVLAYPFNERAGSGAVLLETTLRGLMKQIWPAQPLRASNMPRLWAACEALDSPDARIPLLNPSGGSHSLWRVVDFLTIPDRFDPDAPVAIRVHLPPSTGNGPIMPDALNAWGARSMAAYNALINLAFMWHVPGKLRMPAPGPKRKGRPTHWLQVQDPARYPDLTDNDLIDLCFPVRASRPRRVLVADAQNAVSDLAKAGGVRIVSGTRSINRKLLPPPPGEVLSAPPKRGSSA